jgi:hypothetical protein
MFLSTNLCFSAITDGHFVVLLSYMNESAWGAYGFCITRKIRELFYWEVYLINFYLSLYLAR